MLSNAEMHFLNSLETDLAKLIQVDFGTYEFPNFYILNAIL